MNGAMMESYGDWWSTLTSTYTLPAVAATALFPPLAAPILLSAGAADAYNWYTAVPSSSTLPTSLPAVKPADYALQQQQAAQIEAALARYNKDPAASGMPSSSWVWPVIALVGTGAIVYAMSASKRGRNSYRSQR